MPKDIRNDADMLGILNRYRCRSNVAERVRTKRLAKHLVSERRKPALKTCIR